MRIKFFAAIIASLLAGILLGAAIHEAVADDVYLPVVLVGAPADADGAPAKGIHLQPGQSQRVVCDGGFLRAEKVWPAWLWELHCDVRFVPVDEGSR